MTNINTRILEGVLKQLGKAKRLTKDYPSVSNLISLGVLIEDMEEDLEEYLKWNDSNTYSGGAGGAPIMEPIYKE